MSNDKTEERAAFEAWFDGFRHGWKTERDVAHDSFKAGAEWQARAALSSAPAQPVREPMSEEQIDKLADPFIREIGGDHWNSGDPGIPDDGDIELFARAIERHHGIGADSNVPAQNKEQP